MDRGRVGEERGGKEMDRCPLTEEDDCVFMVMVHPVDPHHFVHASSMVSGCLAEVYAKNSKPKCFEETVPMSLRAYADVFSKGAFNSLPEQCEDY
jgi:hypothetical protein